MISKSELKRRQSWTLTRKILESSKRIIEWHDAWNGKICVSFSGGKDSTVLLHLVRRIYPNVPAVFVNTGLEYPEIVSFVKTIDNVIVLRPKIPFHKIIEKYGYPVISKEVSLYIYQIRNTKSKKLKLKRLIGEDNIYKSGRIPKKWQYVIYKDIKISSKCCDYFKKDPFKRFQKNNWMAPIIGTMANDSQLRRQKYIRNGCNIFDSKNPMSTPIAFWNTKNIWNYIKQFNLNYSDIYKIGYENTGCMFCMFGVHLEKEPNRFQRMQITHPKQWDYCINKLNCKQVLDTIKVPYQNSKKITDYLDTENEDESM